MKFDVHHYRQVQDRPDLMHLGRIRELHLQRQILAKGGRTVVDVWGDDDQFLTTGIAECSRLDPYNKKIGRDIATGRAISRIMDKIDKNGDFNA